MKDVTIYSTRYCPYCTRVKKLFESKRVPFHEIDLSADPEALEALIAKTKWRSVPQVFIGDRFIGGCDDTYRLDAQGELDALLED